MIVLKLMTVLISVYCVLGIQKEDTAHNNHRIKLQFKVNPDPDNIIEDTNKAAPSDGGNQLSGSVGNTPVPCPMGCRCTAGPRYHSRHHWHRVLASYRTQRLLYGPGRTDFPYRPQQNPNYPDVRQMTCVGLPDMPDYLPTDIKKVNMYGSLSVSWEQQQLEGTDDEEEDINELFNSDSAVEPSDGELRQMTRLNLVKSVGVKHLNIEGNRIKVIHPLEFKILPGLKRLHLRNNRIKIVSVGAFDGLVNLQEIDLSKNHIRHLPEITFFNLPRLRKLSISKNRLITLQPSFLEQLTELQHLDISYNFMSDLPEHIFTNNVKLKTLNMASNTFNGIHVDWLANLADLLKLDLSGNFIHNIHNGTFAGLTNLTWLNLDKNTLTQLTVGGFVGLEKLQTLKIENNDISSIQDGVFRGKSSLRELYLDGNFIDTLTQETLAGLDNLKTLSLSYNKLSQVSDKVFRSVLNLQSLHLSHNRLKIVTNRNFYGLLDLRELRLDHNDIRTVEDDGFAVSIVSTYSKLTWLHLNYNKLSGITQRMFQGLSYLKYLNLGHNDVTDIDDSGLAGCNRINTLIINNNSLAVIRPGTFKQLVHMRLLNLGGNKLTSLETNSLLGLDTLEALNIQNNNIQDLNIEAFAKTPKMTSLNIKKNRLQHLDFKLLDQVKTLRYLDASGNKLSTISQPITGRALFSLNLADNFFRSIPDNVTRIVARRGSIRLYGNPWYCDCGLKWLAGSDVLVDGVFVVKIGDIICKSPPRLSGEQISKLKVEDLCNPFGSTLDNEASDSLVHLPQQDQIVRKKLKTGCKFTELGKASNELNDIRASKLDPLAWVINIFSLHSRDWLCSGVRLARDYILVHTSCAKSQALGAKIKISLGYKDENVTSHDTTIADIIFYQGPLDLAIIKTTKIRKSTARIFPCILNKDGLKQTRAKPTNAVVVSMAKGSQMKLPHDSVKFESFLSYTVNDPCVPGRICFKVNEEKFDHLNFNSDNLPIFFKVGKSRWALGGIGSLKSYGNILATPLDNAVQWIHQTI